MMLKVYRQDFISTNYFNLFALFNRTYVRGTVMQIIL